MKRVLLVVVFVLCSASVVSAQCTSVNPGPGWVCVGGGWLPPGSVPVPPPPPPVQAPVNALGDLLVAGQAVSLEGPLADTTAPLTLHIATPILPCNGRDYGISWQNTIGRSLFIESFTAWQGAAQGSVEDVKMGLFVLRDTSQLLYSWNWDRYSDAQRNEPLEKNFRTRVEVAHGQFVYYRIGCGVVIPTGTHTHHQNITIFLTSFR
jgi:hypothetical protein